MNKIVSTFAIVAGLLISATSTHAQIRTEIEDGFRWIIIDGTEGDDEVYVTEKETGTLIELFSKGVLVDSMFRINLGSPGNLPPKGSGGGGSLDYPTAIYAILKGGNDVYYNNSYRFAGDLVSCGAGRDTVYASPRESWVSSDYWDEGRKEIFGDGGDDWLMGGAGHDRIMGGDGNDLISGNDGNDALYGDAGDDDIDGGRGFNWMFGGTGYDTYRADEPANIIYEIAE